MPDYDFPVYESLHFTDTELKRARDLRLIHLLNENVVAHSADALGGLRTTVGRLHYVGRSKGDAEARITLAKGINAVHVPLRQVWSVLPSRQCDGCESVNWQVSSDLRIRCITCGKEWEKWN